MFCDKNVSAKRINGRNVISYYKYTSMYYSMMHIAVSFMPCLCIFLNTFFQMFFHLNYIFLNDYFLEEVVPKNNFPTFHVSASQFLGLFIFSNVNFSECKYVVFSKLALIRLSQLLVENLSFEQILDFKIF